MTDKRVILDKDLAKFREQFPDYSLCQTIFAIVQILRPDGWSKGDLLEITDDDLSKAIFTTMIREKEEN